MMKRFILFLLTICLVSLSAIEFENLGNQVKEINLKNGAKVLLLQDDSAPIVHCVTMANVGGVDETPGITGIAHFLEHLAFKGTQTIGTSDYEAEKEILDQQDAIFELLLEAKENGNEELVAKYQTQLEELDVEASKYVINNEFSQIYTQNGGRNFNAGTSKDFTMYQISLPSNKLELWYTLEADRFTNPVFREFYKERQVILDERLMREVNSPQGQLMKEMMSTAFKVHPYRFTTIGAKEDIEQITRQDVKDFFNKYYGANNLTFIIYGDFSEENAIALSQKYLSTIPAREKSHPITDLEPEQTEERTFTIDYDASPMVMISYHVPAASHPDNTAVEALAAIFGQTETSPLMKTMVYDKKLALYAYSFAGLPGSKYDNLFSIMFAPNNGVEVEECITEIDNILANFLEKGVSDEELTSYRKNSKKSYLTRLDTGIYLPIQIGMMEVVTGDYNDFFSSLDKIDNLRKDEIVKVAQKYLIPTNRSVGILEKAGE